MAAGVSILSDLPHSMSGACSGKMETDFLCIQCIVYLACSHTLRASVSRQYRFSCWLQFDGRAAELLSELRACQRIQVLLFLL
ncbi:hypothetical protein PAMP_017952 [Pampus punctatissimus]